MDFKLCRSKKSRKGSLQEQKFITNLTYDRAMTIGTVDLQTIQQLQKTAARKAKNQTLEKALFGKFQLDGLKLSKILGEKNVKICNNNGVSVDKITPPYSTPQTRIKLATFSRTCDKYAVADLPVAAFASAYFMISATAH
ncbi:hypothetical protein AVEN_153925-1 [Araneus ventricosus]|uniref:Uncharacterized protein n=1 Tax=Araneus ventricosus TaxID=182803 RepID=A0A4Y2F9F9_ARAVE|nr:hypothetical protein AVEN_153925-1 [Araneus ventricosus]